MQQVIMDSYHERTSNMENSISDIWHFLQFHCISVPHPIFDINDLISGLKMATRQVTAASFKSITVTLPRWHSQHVMEHRLFILIPILTFIRQMRVRKDRVQCHFLEDRCLKLSAIELQASFLTVWGQFLAMAKEEAGYHCITNYSEHIPWHVTQAEERGRQVHTQAAGGLAIWILFAFPLSS